MDPAELIIVVEDNHDIQELVRIILSEQGYRTQIVANEQALIVALGLEIPGLILLDMRLGARNEQGVEISKKLKQHAKFNNIPIILMSADSHIEAHSQNANADGYLRKPFAINDLVTIVKDNLRSFSNSEVESGAHVLDAI